jgi:membrane protein
MGDGIGIRLKKIYLGVYEFLTEKWVATHEEATASRLHRFAHYWLLVFKTFSRNRCPLRATALAYTTLLALIPLLAVSFGIASSVLKEKDALATKKLIGDLVDAVAPQLKLLSNAPADKAAPDSVDLATPPPDAQPPGATHDQGPGGAEKFNAHDQLVNQIYALISHAQSATLGITGMAGLILVGILLLSTIEDTFNDIWGAPRRRSWFTRLVQYWTTISLGPIVVFVIVAQVGSTFSPTARHLGGFAFSAQLMFLFVLISCAFALFYKMIPNTQVNWGAALLGGLTGGSLWLLVNLFNAFQLSRVVGMSKIYGTALAVIPIFLVGLYFSWLIVLFGAQVAYALQNRQGYLQEKKAESVNQRGCEYVALRLMTHLAHRFEKGAQPPTGFEIAAELGVPSRLVTRVLQPLVESHLVMEVAGANEVAYAPARPLENITYHDILQTMRVGSGQELETCRDCSRPVVNAEVQKIQEAECEAASTVTLKELVARIEKKKGVVE